MKRLLFAGILCIAHLASSTAAFAQKAGVVTRFVQPASIEEPASRPGLQNVSTALKTNNTTIKWKDTLVTGEGGRIRAQLNDGSILSLGSKSKLIVQKHDEKRQQSAFDLSYGQVRSQVVHLASPDSSFEVRTNTAVCGVLGTDSIADGSSPVETLVIVITGVVAVKNSDPNVVGSTQLTAGQFTVVRQGQAPTGAQTANANQVNGAVNGTTGSTSPQPAVQMSTLQVPSGGIFTLNGAASTGGIGNVINYAWAIPARSFTQSSANPNLSVDTTGWPAGTYAGTLTVTTDDVPAKIATAPFQFSVLALTVPNPADTITALAQAYTSLQPSNFASVFDPAYPGTSALTQQLEQAIPNIQAIQLTYPTPQTAITGNLATCQVNITFNITPKPTPPATMGTPFKYSTGSVNFTLSLNTTTNKWLISGIVGQLGSPGMLSVPGTNNTTSGNTTSSQSGQGTNNSTTNLGLATFGVTSDPSLSTFEGGSVSGTFSVTPANGFLGSVAIAFGTPLPNGVTASTTGVVNIAGTTSASVPFTLTAAANATPGQVLIPYTATSGGITQSGNVTLNILPAGLTLSQNTVTVPVGGFSTNTTVTVAPTPASGYTGSVTFTTTPATVPGLTITPGPLNSNGTVVLKLTSTTATVGSAQFTLNATLGGATVGQPMTVNLVAPFTAGPVPSVTLAALQPQTVTFPVTLNSAFTGSFTVAAPSISGLAFTATTQANSFTVAVNGAGPATYGGNFTVSAGTYSATVPGTFIVNPPFDFTITGASLTLAQGNSTTANIVVTPVPGTGVPSPVPSVQLSISGVPAGFTATFTGPATVSGSGAVTVNVSASGTAPFGSSAFNVGGSFGANSHTAIVSLNIPVSSPPFTITASPATVNVFDGGNGTATVNVQGLPGFTGAVAITSSSTVAQASGPGSITAGNSGNYTVTASGPGSLTFTGTVGSFTQTSSVAVAIVPGFTLSSGSASTFAGGSAVLTVSVNRLAGFGGAVVITPSPASGFSYNPPSATVVAGSSSASFTVTVDPSVSNSSTNLGFSGVAQGGTIAVSTSGSLTINPAFSLTSSPLAGFVGQTVPVTVGVARTSGFSGSVTISLASGLTGVLVTPSSVTVPPGSSSASFSAVITSTGVSGSLGFSGSTGSGTPVPVSVSLTIGAPFTLSTGTNLGTIIAGTSKSANVTVTFSQGFSGSVTLTATPVGPFTAALSSNTLTATGSPQLTVISPPSGTPGPGTIAVTATSGSYSLTANYTVASQVPFIAQATSSTSLTVFHGFSGLISVTVNYNQPFAGSVSVSATAPPGIQAVAQGSTTLTASGPVAFQLNASQTASSGQVVVTINGGGATVAVPFTVSSVDPFSVSVTPPSNLIFSIPGTLTATVTPAAGFTGNVLVTPSVSPAGSATISPTSNSVSVPGSGVNTGAGRLPASLRAQVNGSSSVTFSVSVNSGFVGSTILFSAVGSSGGFSASPSGSTGGGTTTQPGFTLSAPASFPVYSGNVSSVAISVTIPSGGAPVTVTGPTSFPSGIRSIVPSGPNVLTASGTVTFLVVGDVTGSGGAIVNSGSITFTGTSGSTQSPVSTMFTSGAPFTFLVNPTSLLLQQNASGSFVATPTAVNGFAGSVTIVTQGTGGQGSLPSGVTLSGVTSGSQTVNVGQSATFTYLAGGSLTSASNNGSVTAQAGAYITSVPTSISTALAYTLSLAGQTAHFYSGVTSSVYVTVNYSTGYTGSVTVAAPVSLSGIASIQGGCGGGPSMRAMSSRRAQYSPEGAALQVATPGSPTVCFNLTATSPNPTAITGTMLFTATDQPIAPNGNTGSASQNYVVLDPYTVNVSAPNSVVDSVPFAVTVTITPSNGFMGSVNIIPSTNPANSGVFSPASMSVNVTGTTQVTFSLTLNGGLIPGSSVTVGATGYFGTVFSASRTANNSSLISAPFTIATVPGNIAVYDSLSTALQVQVNFATGYVGSVTVSFTGLGGGRITPQGLKQVRNVGQGINSVTANGSTVVASTSNPGTVKFVIVGSGTGSGALEFAASDGVSTATNQATYTAGLPFTVTSSPASIPLFNGITGLTAGFSVVVQSQNGFSGTVTVTAAGAGGNAGTTPTGVTFTGSSTQSMVLAGLGSIQTFVFNYNPSPSASPASTSGTFLLSTSGPSGTYSTTAGPVTISVTPPFTATQSLPTLQDSGSGTYSVTVSGATGFMGTVNISPNLTSVVPAGSITVGSATSISVTNTTPITTNFTANATGGATSANFGATVNAGNYNLTLGPSSVSVATAYTMAVTSIAPTIFSGNTGTVTITVTYNGSYNGTVVVSPPTGVFSGLSQISPSTISVTKGSNTATFTVTASGTNPSQKSGTLSFTGSDGNGNTGSASSNYTVVDPYSVSTTAPSNPYTYGSGSYKVTIMPATGFSGSVSVTPSSTGANIPGGAQTVQVTSGTNTVVTFTVNFTNTTPAGLAANTSITYSGTTNTFSLGVANINVNVATAYSSAFNTPVIYSGIAGNVPVTVTFATGYVGTVTVTPKGFATGIASLPAAQVASPGSPTVTFVFTGTASNPTGTPSSGYFQVTDVGGNVLNSPTQNFNVVDPYTVNVSAPNSVVDSVPFAVTVTITPSNGFMGSVNIIPSTNPANSGVFSPASMSVNVTSTTQVTFSLTLNGGLTPGSSVTVAAIGSYQSVFSAKGTAQNSTLISAPFTIATIPGNIAVFDSLSTALQVQVNFATGYVGSVTVSFTGLGGGRITPQGLKQVRNVGQGINSVTANGSTVVASTSNPGTVNFVIVGSGTGSGTLQFSATDGVNTASNQATYTADLPFSVSAPSAISLFNGVPSTVPGQVTSNNGFAGTVTVTAAGAGGTAGSLPTGVSITGSTSQQVVLSANGTQNFSFSYNPSPSASPASTSGTFLLKTVGANGTYSTTAGPVTISVQPPFTATQTLPTLQDSGIGTYSVTVTGAAGFVGTVNIADTGVPTGGSITLAPPTSISVTNTTPITTNFSATLGGGVTSVVFGATVNSGGYNVTLGPSTVTVTPAYTLSITTSAPSIFSGGTGTVTVKATYSGSYNGSITLSPPSGTIAGVSQFNPGGATLTPGSNSVTFTVVATSSNPTQKSGTLTFNGSDGNGNNTQASIGYTVVDPYSVSTTAPTNPYTYGSGSYKVTIMPATGFSGSVTVTPQTVGASIPGGAQTVQVNSGSNTVVTFTANFTSTTPVGLAANSSTTYPGTTNTFSLPVANINVNLATAYSSSFNTPAIYSGITSNVPVTVTFATGYAGTVTVTPKGFATGIASLPAAQVASPGSPTVTFVFTGTASNPTGTASSGYFQVTDVGGNVLNSPTQNFNVFDPYTAFTSNVPGTLDDNVQASYTITISPNSGFSGTVLITPTTVPSGVATFSPTSITANVPANTGFSGTVNVTLHAGVTGSVTLGAATMSQSFSLNANAATPSVSMVPFTITSVNPSPVYVYDSLTSTVTVNVQFATGYTGNVTISFGGASGASPQSGRGRSASGIRRAMSGGGISTVTAVGSATLTASGSVTFNVIGAGSGGGTLTFNASDGTNMTSGTTSYSADIPVTYTIQASPLRLFNGVSTTVQVQVNSNNNFAGSVDFTAAGSGFTSGSFPSGSLPANVTIGANQSQQYVQISSGGSVTFNVIYTAAANATDATVNDAFVIGAGGGGYKSSSAMQIIVALPFTTTLGTGSAGPMTVPQNGGTNQVTVNVTVATGYSGSVAITAPNTAGVTIAPSGIVCGGSCTNTFTLTGGSTAQALTTANYSVTTTPGNYSINLSSQYDVTSFNYTSTAPTQPYFIGDAGAFLLNFSNTSFYGTIQVSTGAGVAPFMGLQISGPSTVNLASGPGTVTLAFYSQGTPADAGTGKTLATQVTIGATGSPNLQMPNVVFNNFGLVTTVAPFTLAIGSVTGPSGSGDNRVFTGSTAQGDDNGIPSTPNATSFSVNATIHAGYSNSNYVFTSSSTSGTVTGCLGGFSGCQGTAAYGPGSSFLGTAWFVQTGASQGSGSNPLTITYNTTGTGGGTFTATASQTVVVTPPYTIGSPSFALGGVANNPISINQGTSLTLNFPVSFATGYSTSAGNVTIVASINPAGVGFSATAVAYPASPTLAIGVGAQLNANVGTTSNINLSANPIAGSSYIGALPTLIFTVNSSTFTITAPTAPTPFDGPIPQALTYQVNSVNGFSASVMLVMTQTGNSGITFACASSGAGTCGDIPGNPISAVLASGQNVTVYYTALTAANGVTAGSDVLTVTGCAGNAVYTGTSCTGTVVKTFTFPVSVTAPKPVPNPGSPFNLSPLSYSSLQVTMNALNGFTDTVYTTLGDGSGLSNCIAPYDPNLVIGSTTISPNGVANIGVTNYLFVPVSLYVYGSFGSGGFVCVGPGGTVMYYYAQLGRNRPQGGKGRNGDLAITPQDITASPARPRRGETVQFQVKVENLGAVPVSNVVVAMMLGGKEVSRVTIPTVGVGAPTPTSFSWKAANVTEPQFSFVVDPDRRTADPNRSNNAAVMKAMSLDGPAPGAGNGLVASSHERMTMTINNESCAGVRLISSAQSSCGGRNDMEVMPAINSTGRLTVQMVAPGGGMQDLGAMSFAAMPDVSQLTGGTLQAQSDFQQGHVYLIKSGNGLAMVRVTKITSSINPKLAMVLAGPGPGGAAGGSSSGSRASSASSQSKGTSSAASNDVLASLRDQQQADQILNSARVMIDLEWVKIEMQ